MPFIIAIDGPAGAGKSTVARHTARALEYTYLDTGAMYRAVAWLTLNASADLSDEVAIAAIAEKTHVEFGPLDAEFKQTVTINGIPATQAIRTPEVSAATSKVATLATVREHVVQSQRQIAQRAPRGVVLEGRDIGTVVFPRAELKVFLTASPEERARRRVLELNTTGSSISYEQVLADQKERDERDSNRAVSPLRPATDAHFVNTDGKSVDEVVGEILDLARAIRGESAV